MAAIPAGCNIAHTQIHREVIMAEKFGKSDGGGTRPPPAKLPSAKSSNGEGDGGGTKKNFLQFSNILGPRRIEENSSTKLFFLPAKLAAPSFSSKSVAILKFMEKTKFSKENIFREKN